MTKQSFAVKLSLALALAGAAWAAQAQPSVNVTVGGIIKPGVYGRVEVGTQPPPPIIYPQPVIITQPVIVTQPGVIVQQRPIYMHVPPGHAKHWDKHCYKYNACNQPVYFVRNEYAGYQDGRGYRGERERDHDDDRRGGGERRGHGRGRD
jgi:hypothetical protein